MGPENSFGAWLASEFRQRHQKHPKYSLRAFARHIGLTPGRVSELFRDQRGLSDEKIQEVIARLKLSDSEAQKVREMVVQRRVIKKEERVFGTEAELPSLKVLKEAEFEAIAEPIHYALLALMDAGISRSKFSEKLGVDQKSVDQVIQRLLQIGLIKKMETTDSFQLVENWVTTETDRYSEAIRLHHKRKLHHAIESIEKVPINKRDITSWSMSIDTDKIPEAKKLIQSFQRKLTKLMTSTHQTEVYHLNIQLVPFHFDSEAENET